MDGLIKLFEWLSSIWVDYLSPIVFCRSYEQGVILYLGKFDRVLKKGINWKWVYPFNEAHKCSSVLETKKTPVLTITTNDGVTASIGLVGRYKIIDEKKWLLEAMHAETNLTNDWIMSASDHLTDCSWDECKNKKEYTEIKTKVNRRIEYLGAEFVQMGYSSICKGFAIALFNEEKIV